jgi:hypothetical protein
MYIITKCPFLYQTVVLKKNIFDLYVVGFEQYSSNPIYNLTIKVFINPKVVTNPTFDNLTEQINLLSSHPTRFSPRNFV